MTGASGLRRWRHEHNVTQAKLAELVRERGAEKRINLGCSDQLVGKWERGEIHWPTPEYRQILQEVTGLTPKELGFVPPAEEPPIQAEGRSDPLAARPAPLPTVAEEHGDQEEPVERRTLLTGAAGLALAASLTRPPVGSSPRFVGATDVRVIQNMLTSLSDSDHQFGGGHAREYATDYLHRVVVPRLHAHSEEHVRRELFGVATQFALRVGWMHLDVGQVREARQYLGLAFNLAEEVGDPILSAWVLAMRGLQEIWLNNVDHALAYTEGAVGMARKASPAARAFILGKNALAVSMTGARDDTLRLLGAVRDIYDTAGAEEEPAWTGIYGWGYVRDEEGHCYRNIGLGAQAVEAAEDALRLRGPDGYVRIRAFSTGIRAIGYAQAGELEAACAAGHELVKLAGELASRRVNARLAEVFTHLSPYQDDPRVKDLREAARPVLSSALSLAN